MHPNVTSEHPGKCPECGMDFVLKKQAIESKPKEIDPVCGMKVNPDGAKNVFEIKGKTYYFCGKGCLEKFKNDPDKYLKPSPAPAKVAKPVPPSEGTIYTCPMHPEVRQRHPGGCPKCGMALEPLTIVRGAEDNSEMADMERRFWISAGLTLPLIAWMLDDILPGHPLQ